MLQNALKKRPPQYGFKEQKGQKISPFIGEWRVWKRLNDNLCIMYKQKREGFVFAPLYIHSFSFIIPKNNTNANKFKEMYPNPDLIEHTGVKIRYFRHQKELRQKDLAEYVGFTRSAMTYFESTERDFYEIDVLKKISELLEVDIVDLLDDYNLFLYQGQSEKLKKFRKENHITQRQLAGYLGVDITKIKGWEQNKARMPKSNYYEFVSFVNSFQK